MTEQVCVGMFRPHWEDIDKLVGYIQCTCGQILQVKPAVREHWQSGHFDTPVYRDAEEVVGNVK